MLLELREKAKRRMWLENIRVRVNRALARSNEFSAGALFAVLLLLLLRMGRLAV